MDNRKIIIRSRGGVFSVNIEPAFPEGGNYSANYPDIKGARGYASGLKLAHRFPILDMTGEAAHA